MDPDELQKRRAASAKAAARYVLEGSNGSREDSTPGAFRVGPSSETVQLSGGSDDAANKRAASTPAKTLNQAYATKSSMSKAVPRAVDGGSSVVGAFPISPSGQTSSRSSLDFSSSATVDTAFGTVTQCGTKRVAASAASFRDDSPSKENYLEPVLDIQSERISRSSGLNRDCSETKSLHSVRTSRSWRLSERMRLHKLRTSSKLKVDSSDSSDTSQTENLEDHQAEAYEIEDHQPGAIRVSEVNIEAAAMSVTNDNNVKAKETITPTMKNSNSGDYQAIAAEIAPDSLALEQERDKLKEELEKARSESRIVPMAVAMAVDKDDQGYEKAAAEARQRYRRIFAAAFIFLAIIGVVLGILLGSRDAGNEGAEEMFFDQIGDGVDGGFQFAREGSSLSLSGDGALLAVANTDGVDIFRQDQEEKGWKLYPSPQIPESCSDPSFRLSESEEDLRFALRSDIVVDLANNGDYLAVGCPLASANLNGTDVEHVGVAVVYKVQGDEWIPVGDMLVGFQQESHFGSSLSLSRNGRTLAIGAPGPDGKVAVRQVDEEGRWIPLGSPIKASLLLLSIGSVSLSADGTFLAIAGVPIGGGDAVARVFRFVEDEWELMGNGIPGNLDDTAYVVNLSGNGKVIGLSNYYVRNAGDLDNGLNADLDCRVFQWSEDTQDWVQLGQDLHAMSEGPKSGYFLSLSDDGKLMGMGDPGRRFENEGSASGHAHLYYFDENDWIQLGPNEYGEGSGDQFGYSVSLSGDGTVFAVSAPFNRGRGFEHGRVYAFDIELSRFVSR